MTPAYYLSKEWRALRLKVLERDGGICQYCGSKGIQADHVKPRERGGKDALSNLVCACPSCNRVVGNRVFKDFAAKRAWIREKRGIEIPGAIPGELPADTKARLKREREGYRRRYRRRNRVRGKGCR